MPMGAGLWHNPQTEFVVNVDEDGSGTHDAWIAKPLNAERIGLSELAQKVISESNDIDEIRMTAIWEGLVRTREYKNHVSVTIAARKDLKNLLRKVYNLVRDYYGEFSYIILHDIATRTEVRIFLPDLNKKLETDQPILPEAETEMTQDQRLLNIFEKMKRIKNAKL